MDHVQVRDGVTVKTDVTPVKEEVTREHTKCVNADKYSFLDISDICRKNGIEIWAKYEPFYDGIRIRFAKKKVKDVITYAGEDGIMRTRCANDISDYFLIDIPMKYLDLAHIDDISDYIFIEIIKIFDLVGYEPQYEGALVDEFSLHLLRIFRLLYHAATEIFFLPFIDPREDIACSGVEIAYRNGMEKRRKIITNEFIDALVDRTAMIEKICNWLYEDHFKGAVTNYDF